MLFAAAATGMMIVAPPQQGLSDTRLPDGAITLARSTQLAANQAEAQIAGDQVSGAQASVPQPPIAPAPGTQVPDATATPPASQPADSSAAPSPEQPATASGPSIPPPVDAQSDIVVTGRSGPPPGDPLEKINAQSFEAVQSVDRAVVEPLAKGYNKGLPRPVRKGLRNFFTNLGEPIVAVAYLAQLKPGKAFETVGRFGINTTLGVAGLFDVAKRKPFNLPYRPNGLANTLGYYGVGPGPYMYLPIIGPTTLRDLAGDTVDKLILPMAIGKPFNKPAYVIPATVLRQLGERAAFDERIQEIRAEDRPYAAYRELYLNQRKAEIEALHGRVTPDVVPVYGRGLRVPGGKTQPEKTPEPQ